MTFGDLSSLVQLGVGIHAGTAVLQLLREFDLGPVERRIGELQRWRRMKEESVVAGAQLVNDLPQGLRSTQTQETIETIRGLQATLDIIKIPYEREYRKMVFLNFAIAFELLAVLIVITFGYSYDAPVWLASMISMLSFGPAAFSFLYLRRKIRRALRPLESRIKRAEALITTGI